MDKRNILDPRARLVAVLDANNDADLIEYLAPEELFEMPDELVDARIEQLGLTEAVERLEARARELTQPQLRRTVTVSPVDKLCDALDDDVEQILAMSDEEVDQELAAIAAQRGSVVPLNRVKKDKKQREERRGGGRLLGSFEHWYSRAAGVLAVVGLVMAFQSPATMMTVASVFGWGASNDTVPEVIVPQDTMMANNDRVLDLNQVNCGETQVYDEVASACVQQVAPDDVQTPDRGPMLAQVLVPDVLETTPLETAQAPELPVHTEVEDHEPVSEQDAVDPVDVPVMPDQMVAAVDTTPAVDSAPIEGTLDMSADATFLTNIAFSNIDDAVIANVIGEPKLMRDAHLELIAGLTSPYVFDGANGDRVQVKLNQVEDLTWYGALFEPETRVFHIASHGYPAAVSDVFDLEVGTSVDDIQMSFSSDTQPFDLGFKIDWTSLDADQVESGEWQVVQANFADDSLDYYDYEYDDIKVEITWSAPHLQCGTEENACGLGGMIRATDTDDNTPPVWRTGLRVAYLDPSDVGLTAAVDNLSEDQGILVHSDSIEYGTIRLSGTYEYDVQARSFNIKSHSMNDPVGLSDVVVWSPVLGIQDAPEVVADGKWMVGRRLMGLRFEARL